MIGSKRLLHLACLGGVIAVVGCGAGGTAAADEMTLAWTLQLASESFEDARAVATDVSGNVYVAGWTGGTLGGAKKGGAEDADAFVRKYDSSGRLLWRRQPGTEASDYAWALATDAAGDVYVAGYTYGSLGGAKKGGAYDADAWVRKYDPSGRLLWQRQPGTETFDLASAVATDAAGDVYVGGWTYGALGGAKKGANYADAWVRKYDPSGRLLWQRQRGSVAEDTVTALATDAAGDVYLAGTTYGSIAGAHQGRRDAWVMKYSAAGQLLWMRQLGTDGIDLAYGLATDAAGDVYVAGTEFWRSLGGAYKGGVDAWVMKFDPSGVLLWKRQPGTARNEGAGGVAADAAGNVYLVGGTLGWLGGANHGDVDAWVIKYDPSGQILWRQQPGTPEADYASAVATDSAGSVYLVGGTSGSLAGAYEGRGDAFLLKFSATE